MKKTHNEVILPIEISSFIEDANNLFASPEEIKVIMDGLEKTKHQFSTSFIKKLLKTDTKRAASIRSVLIFIIHVRTHHEASIVLMQNELISVGCNKVAVHGFFARIEKMSKETSRACTDLYDVMSYGEGLSTLISNNLEINHTFLKADRKKMTARVSLKLAVKGTNELKEIHIDMDADEYESFISNLIEGKKTLITESKELKELLGNKYIMPIGDE